MKKINLLFLLTLLAASQLFAQQSQSFAEYWFGIRQQAKPKIDLQTRGVQMPQKNLARIPQPNANGIITLDLSAPLNPTTFEVTPSGFWTETYNDTDYTFFETNAPFSFSHLIEGAGSSYGGAAWNGFTYSKNGSNANHGSTGSSTNWISNQWGNMASGGIKTDADGNILKDANGVVLTDTDIPYLIAYWSYTMEPEYFADLYFGTLTEPTHNLQTRFTDGNSYEAVGVYINNHPWPYYGNISGDGFARSFAEGDYFKLYIHGLDAAGNETGKSVEHVLAEYKNGQLVQSPNWEWVDLSSLGEIGGLYYTLKTTDEGIYGPNTAAYFCMDKLQIKVKQTASPTVSLRMNDTSETMKLENKATGATVEVGTATDNKYTFQAAPGTYLLTAYDSGNRVNGTMELIVTEATSQEFQVCTFTTDVSGWNISTDYTVELSIKGADGTDRFSTLGRGVLDWLTFLTLQNDTYSITYVPSEARKNEGFRPITKTGVMTKTTENYWPTFKKSILYTITAPKEATVYVGVPNYSGYYYRPFTEVVADNVATEGENKVYSYYIVSGQSAIYRISQVNHTTYASTFVKGASPETLLITQEMLQGDPKAVDYNVSSNNGYNASDIYLNINERGFLKLTTGRTHQIVNMRTWQTVNTVTANLFIEPDYHYTVIDENGNEDASVVTINEKGLLTAVGSGTAIVLVTYDAIKVASATGGPLFSALWPENTGVFVVSVDGAESGIVPNMTINEELNRVSDKVAGIYVDAELDVFYYNQSEGSFKYTFTPQGVTSVLVAQPTLGANSISYSGFEERHVTKNSDGSYTVALTHGRNIVKLLSESGVSYQVLTAKPVSYTVTNNTQSGATIEAGNEITIRFNTLYHPANKLAGIYNMTAYIQYTANETSIVNRGNQYRFASADNGQTITTTIPEDWNTQYDFVLSSGVLRAGGTSGLNYGDPFGSHREVTLESGKNPNFTASLRQAYFGALPHIAIPVGKATTSNTHTQANSTMRAYPNPFVDYVIVNTAVENRAYVYDATGKLVVNIDLREGENRINTTYLPNGIYFIKSGTQTLKIVK